MLIRIIKELDEETQKIIMLQLKLDIESVYHGHHALTKGWEEMRYKNMYNHQKVTVQGQCEACETQYPLLMNIIEFLKRPYVYVYFERKTSDDLKKVQKLKCMNCGKQNSVHIPYTMIDEEYYGISPQEQTGYGV